MGKLPGVFNRNEGMIRRIRGYRNFRSAWRIITCLNNVCVKKLNEASLLHRSALEPLQQVGSHILVNKDTHHLKLHIILMHEVKAEIFAFLAAIA